MNHRFAIFLLAIPVLGQTDQGRIVGTVADGSGAVIPGAAIQLTNEKTGAQRQGTSEGGAFAFTNLTPSLYKITVTAAGFAKREFQQVPLQTGETRRIEVVLQPESVSESVTVSSGELVEVDTSSARIGVNVSEREVATLPINGRQLSQLYLMAPGAVTAGGGTYDNIRFSGRANQQNAIRFDGIEGSSIIDASPGNLNGETSSSFRLQASLENVQEFRVESNSYPAAYGTGTGGQVSVVSKSGSNAFHGGIFEYLRNSAFDARNFFDRGGPSALRLNQFGGSAGGYIVKDKLFFFASIEALRQRSAINFVQTTPSAAAWSRAVPAIATLRPAFPVGVGPTADPNFDVAFLNAGTRLDETAGHIRFDYHINGKLTLTARYMRDQGESFAPFDVTRSAFLAKATPQNGLLALQQVLSPTIINETKFGVNSQKTRTNGVAPQVPGLDLSATTIQLSGSVALAGIGGQGGSAGIATPSGLVRANSATNGRGQPYTNYTLSFIDNLVWVRKKHTFKFGGEIRPARLYTDRLGGTTYTFPNITAFLANQPTVVQFLGDVSAPSPFNGGVTGNRQGQTEIYVAYAQDEWKLRPNLTLSYGLRYEYYSPMREAKDRDVLFNLVDGTLKPPGAAFYQALKTNFGPRLALSWAPTALRNRTVFRAGAGYYYGPGQLEDQIQPIESDRVSTTVANGTYPINPAQIIANYNPNSPTARYQPRAYSPGYKVPEQILTYTASIQQQLPFDSLLTVAFVGSQGRNLFLRSITNKISAVATNPTTGAAIVTREFGDRYAEIDFKTSGGRDRYDALQTTFNRRFSKGLTAGLQWSYSRSFGNSSGSNEAKTAQDPFNFRGDFGYNNFDVRHSLNLNVLYQIPFFKANRLLGGWEIGGIQNYRTGLPIDVTVTRPDVVYRDNRNGSVVANPILVNGVPVTTAIINTPGGGNSRNVRRPDVVAGVNPFLSTGDGRFFLNPAAFTVPQPGTFGNYMRNALHGPSLAQTDLTLHKRFAIREAMNIEFRAEVYNVFNKANFANPPSVLQPTLGLGANQVQPGQPLSSATAGSAFGVLNQTVERQVGLGTGRQIQLSLRFNF